MKKIMGLVFVVGLVSCPLAAMKKSGDLSSSVQQTEVSVGSKWKVPGIGPVKVLAIKEKIQKGFYTAYENIDESLRVETTIKGVSVYAQKIVVKKSIEEKDTFSFCGSSFDNFSFGQSQKQQNGFCDVEKERQEQSLIGTKVFNKSIKRQCEIVGINGIIEKDDVDPEEELTTMMYGKTEVLVRVCKKKSQSDGQNHFDDRIDNQISVLQKSNKLFEGIGKTIHTENWFGTTYAWVLVAVGDACPNELVSKGAVKKETKGRGPVWVLIMKASDLELPKVKGQIRSIGRWAVSWASKHFLGIDEEESKNLAKNVTDAVWGEEKKKPKDFGQKFLDLFNPKV